MSQFAKNTVIILFFTTFLTLGVDAQIPDPSSIANPSNFATISISPENPNPNQEVTATIEYYLTDLKKSEISWFLNGSLQKSGVGETKFNFKTGPSGSSSRLSVSINPLEGPQAQAEITIRPADVDIIWNADTYTPPFYKGKALFTNKANLTFVAIPHFVNSSGNKINSQSLVYNWYEGSKIINNQSGVGKNTLKIEGKTISRPLDIRVEIETFDGSIKASNRIEVDLSEPKILVYEKNPLYGLILGMALNSFSLKEQEVTLSAVPYFFNTFTRDSSNMKYNWTQNGEKINLPTQESSIILRQVDSNLSGRISVGITALNTDNQLQNDSTSLEINVGNR